MLQLRIILHRCLLFLIAHKKDTMAETWTEILINCKINYLYLSTLDILGEIWMIFKWMQYASSTLVKSNRLFKLNVTFMINILK